VGRQRQGQYNGRPLPPEVRIDIRTRLRRGERWADIAASVGVAERTVARVLRDSGGMPPRWKDRSPLRLSLADREEISRGVQAGESFRQIGTRLNRPTSTISREVKRHGGKQEYRAWRADRDAWTAARRPKPTVFETRPRLKAYVEKNLTRRWSPQEISKRLKRDHPADEEMRVSPETIYQSLFVQTRGGLRKELAKQLRTGRTRRRPHTQTTLDKRGKISNMTMISERPAEVEDRAVPGHWEGDLIIGKNGDSAIGTLVERVFRLTLLLHLPNGRNTDEVTAAIQRQIAHLPEELLKTLTWDQGKELAAHAAFSIATGIPVYFCEPHKPWQRGTNENTNGLLRQYFPKGTDLSIYTQADLDAVAAELNERPRRALAYLTPSEAFTRFVALTA